MKVYLACYTHAEHAGPGILIPASNSVPDWFRKAHGLRVVEPEIVRAVFIPEYRDVELSKAGQMTKETFLSRFDQHVRREWTNRNKQIRRLLDAEPTFFCYEAPGEMCHRRALAAIFRDTGYEVILDGKHLPDPFYVIPQPPQIPLF